MRTLPGDKHRHSEETLAWAAYVLGHHAVVVRNWLWQNWAYRRELARGKLTPDRQVPVEVSELLEVIEVLGSAGVFPAELTARMQRATRSLASAASAILRQLRSPDPRGGQFNWRSDSYPGVSDAMELDRASDNVFEDNAPLEKWRKLGEHLGSLRNGWSFSEDDRRTTIAMMKGIEGYPFLTDVRSALSNETAGLPRSFLAQITNPDVGYLDVGRVEQYVRLALREEAAPEPWFELTQEYVALLKTRWRHGEFSDAQLGILWLLCEQPCKPVTRNSIWEACRLDCGLDHIKSHVTRLRNRLHPAIENHFQSRPWPEHADQCFIVGLREGLGPYQLTVPSPRVAVQAPRPDFMKPVKTPAGTNSGAAFRT